MDNIPIVWIILSVVSFTSLVNMMNIANFINFAHEGYMPTLNILVNEIQPTITMILLSAFLCKAILSDSGSLQTGKNIQVENSVFRAKLALTIVCIFISAQVLTWIFLILNIVRFLSQTFQKIQINKNVFFFRSYGK